MPSPKKYFGGEKTKVLPDDKSHDRSILRNIIRHKKKKVRRIWVKEPDRSENVQPKSVTSTVARVPSMKTTDASYDRGSTFCFFFSSE